MSPPTAPSLGALMLLFLLHTNLQLGQAWIAVSSASSYIKCSSCLAAKRSKGFGTTAASSKVGFASPTTKQQKKKQVAPHAVATLDLVSHSKSIEEVLNPKHLKPEALEDTKARLRDGQVVILRDAFVPELAEALYSVLSATDNWDHNEDYQIDGYHYRHFNIYDRNDFPHLCQDFQNNVLESDATKEFMSSLTGRDCTGELVSGAPSYYSGGDHSLPHTDHIGGRTVAYILHLSKNWRPEWGGALYWAQEPLANAFHHASFNSLCLFSVTPHSAHFVTTVSPLAKEKRLAYNGWWHSDWVPTAQDKLEDLLATPEQRLALTHAQILAIQDLLDDPWAPRIQPPERHAAIEALRGKIMEELYPPSLASFSPPKFSE